MNPLTLYLSLLVAIIPLHAEEGFFPGRDRPVVTTADYFFYVCVAEYMEAQSIRNFDGSEGHAVEWSEEPPEVLIALHGAASEYARTIPAPDYSDPEHGLPAVLALCKTESATERVSQIVTKARLSGE